MQLLNINNTIYIEFYSRSKLIKRSLNLSHTKQNLKYAKTTLMPIFAKLNSINTKQPNPKKPIKNKTSKITLSAICNDYINAQNFTKLTTAKTAKYALKRAFSFISDKPISLYTQDDFKECLSGMKTKLSSATIRLILGYIFAVFRYAKHINLIKFIPFSKHFLPKKYHKPKQILTPFDIKTILKKANGELRIFLYIALFSGARSGEILALNKSDINFNHNTISISKNQTRFELTTPKNGTSREVIVPSSLINFLKSLNLKDGKIFTHDYFLMYYKFKKLLKSLNLPIYGLHITRHIYANTLMMGFVSPQFIANALGHSSLNLVNQTYSHFITNKKEIAKMQKVLNFE